MSILNPFDPFANFTPPDEQSVSRIRPYRPAERDSLLSQLTGNVMGGVGYVGNLIDKLFGARAVRGTLGGRPEELLSLIPGSDVLGITNESNRVSGEDLAKSLGILEGGGQKGSFELRDLVGPALEIGLDPATYLSFGASALSKSGKIAKKIGVLPKTGAQRAAATLGELTTTKDLGQLGQMAKRTADMERALRVSGMTTAEALGQKLGGNIGFGLPLGENLATADIMPALSSVARTAGSFVPGPIKTAASKVGEIASPIGYSLAALFDPSVAGAVTPAGREVGREFTESVGRRSKQIEMQVARAATLADEAARGGYGGLYDPPVVRDFLENTVAGPPHPALPEFLNVIRDINDTKLKSGVEAGILDPVYGTLRDKYADYGARQASRLPREPRKGAASRALPESVGAMSARIDPFRDIPGGTGTINALSLNPQFSGVAHTLPADVVPNRLLQNTAKILKDTLGMTPEMRQELTLLKSVPRDVLVKGEDNLQTLLNTFNLTKEQERLLDRLASIPDLKNAPARLDELQGLLDKAKSLSSIMAERSPEYLQAGVPYFGNHPLLDALATAKSTLQADEAARAKARLVARSATNVPLAGYLPLNDVLKSLGMADFDLAPAQKLVRQELGRLPMAPPSQGDLLAKLFVAPEAVSEANRMASTIKIPEFLQPLVSSGDTLTNLFKTGNTTMWPGYHFRNKAGNVSLNVGSGGFGIESGQMAKALLSGKTIPGASQMLPELAGMTDEAATKRLAELAAVYAGVGRARGLAMESGQEAAVKSLQGLVPGLAPPESFGQIIKAGIPKTKEELKNIASIRGAFGYGEDVSKPVIAGRKIAQKLEDQDLLAHFIEKVKQGYTPEVAGAEAKAALGDYSNMTDFEKQVMRRLVPFFSWQRSVAPGLLTNIAQRPGGIIPQAIRASNAFRDQAGFVPEHVGQGLAIPVGQEEGGTQRFLSGLGLPHEQILEPLRTGPKAAQGTLMALAGQLNPIVKMPLEYMTGKQFFSGRDLDRLYSLTAEGLGTRLPLLDQLLANSPLARASTSLRTLADERKGMPEALLNLGTGARLTDADIEKFRNLAVQDLITQELSGSGPIRTYTTPYVKPEDISQLSPRDVALLRLKRTLEEEGHKRAKRIGVRR